MTRRTAAEAVIESTTTGRASAFGEIRPESSRLPGEWISPGDAAAANLVDKALRALERDDAEAAARSVSRAVRLPYDEHEEWWPALQAAHMALYETVADALEAAPEGDPAWLDAALEVLAEVAGADGGPPDEVAASELRHVLGVVRRSYDLSRDESRRLDRALAPGRPTPTSVPDLGPEVPEQEREQLVVRLLRAVLLLRLALAAR